MADAWLGPTCQEQTLAFGPLALVVPMLQRLGVADSIDAHLPPDPQLRYSHGRVLSLLLAARLCQPTALVNISTWAESSGADLLWNMPAEDLNDDRLGRALDAFFAQRHAIQAAVAAETLRLAELSPSRLHFDPTHLHFHGAYSNSVPRPDPFDWPPAQSSAQVPPAHITHGYGAEEKLIQVGVTAVIDDLGAVPILSHCVDGNQNGHTAIHQQCAWLRAIGFLEPGTLLISDRGTFSIDHVARLHRYDCQVLCSVPWNHLAALYEANAATLTWHDASYLSREQQRRRETPSALPLEHYELAVLRHTVTDPETADAIPCRVIFVYSTADADICRRTRERDLQHLQSALAEIVASVARGHPLTTPDSIARRVTRLFGNRAARHFFQWEMVPLTVRERAALPPPARGCRRPLYRFTYTFDAVAAAAAAATDGLSVLLTTAPRTESADRLFTQFKEQNYLETSHHQWKTPLAVRPVFLKSPKRVEALVCLMQLALTAQHLLERFYRRSVPAGAPLAEQRLTAESLLRIFRPYGLIVRHTQLGQVIHATRLTSRQRDILRQLGFPTPAQLLAQVLPPLPALV